MTGDRVRAVLRAHGVDGTACALGVAALLLYASAATWGLPQATNPIQIRGWDVDGVAGIGVLSELHNLLVEPKPDWYTAYPLFHYLLLAVLYAPYLGLLLLTGSLAAPSADYPFGFTDPARALEVMAVAARVLTVVMASAVVMMCYAAGKQLWGRRGGIVAASVLALSSPMVYYARTSNLDVPVLFWTALGVLVVLRALSDGLTIPRAFAIGLTAALSVGTKDQAYGAWLPAIALVLWHHRRTLGLGRSTAGGASPRKAPLVLIGTGLATFAAANGVFIRPSRLPRHLSFITSFEETFPNLAHENGLTVLHPPSLAGYAGLVGDLGRATAMGMSLPLMLAGLLAALVLWKSRPRARVLIWMAAGFVVLTLFPLHHIQYRYTLFPIFALATLAGGLVSDALRPPFARVAFYFLLGIGLAWQLGQTVDITYQMRNDARYPATAWIRATLQVGDSVGFFGAMHQLPHLPPGVELVPLMGAIEEQNKRPEDWTEYLVVAPDYYSDAGRERSTILPEGLYARLLDGSLGYQRMRLFRTEPLTGRPIAYLPYVNPQVQVFRRESVR